MPAVAALHAHLFVITRSSGLLSTVHSTQSFHSLAYLAAALIAY